MIVTLLGTRGSLPSAGPDTVRYGGNTPCIQLHGDQGALLVLDAGTGVRRLDRSAWKSLDAVHLLLTHLHMDHIQGLGFFEPLFEPECDVTVWGPPSITHDLRLRLTRYLSPPLFPSRLRDLPCRLCFNNIPRGTFEVAGFEVTADVVIHPGTTMGFRVSDGSSVVAYLPDHEPALGVDDFPGEPEWTSGYDLSKDVDLLVHDAQYSSSEYARHIGWGHSSFTQAFDFAILARAKRLVTFHHDPAHDDATIDRLLERACRGRELPFELIPGTEGTRYRVP